MSETPQEFIERDAFEQRLVAIYAEATGAQRALHGARVRIHVAEDVWEEFKAMARRYREQRVVDAITNPTLWGFDILCEMAWEPGRVVVRTETEIA